MKRVFVVLAALVAAPLAADGGWYSIDGFTISVADDVVIDPARADDEHIYFREAGAADWLARAIVVFDDPRLAAGEEGLVTLLRTLRDPSATAAITSLGMSHIPDAPGAGGWAISVQYGAVRWDCFLIELPPTPGRRVRSLLFIPRRPSDEGQAALQQIFKGLEIRIEQAAG